MFAERNAAVARQRLKEGQQCFFAKPPDVRRAVTLFTEVTRLAPGWAEGFGWLASAQAQLSRLDAAESSYRQAILLAPADARHPISLGDVLARAGRLEEAVNSFRAGLALKPHYSEADCRVMLASTLKRLGKIDEAVSEWRMVAGMEPMYPSYDDPIQEAKRELKRHQRSA
jgi:Flp pilus assembly protein TadD